MFEELGTEGDIDSARRMAEHIVAQCIEHHIEQRDHQQAETKHIKRAQALMCEHLIDHYLKEQRCDQGKKLNKQRGNKHLPQYAFMFNQSRNKPGHIKAP